jgi:hypothetical protein
MSAMSPKAQSTADSGDGKRRAGGALRSSALCSVCACSCALWVFFFVFVGVEVQWSMVQSAEGGCIVRAA